MDAWHLVEILLSLVFTGLGGYLLIQHQDTREDMGRINERLDELEKDRVGSARLEERLANLSVNVDRIESTVSTQYDKFIEKLDQIKDENNEWRQGEVAPALNELLRRMGVDKR